MSPDTARPVLVTGATGYVGGRLVPLLLGAGYRVRALARGPAKLARRAWAGDPRVEIVQGDVLDAASLEKATQGCGAVFYLVHSMEGRGQDVWERDRAGARNMRRAADAARVERTIYLGGLGDPKTTSSPHLRSRHEVGEILQSGRTPTTHLRAGMILGAGSASFEILRYLVERLPVMITPRWVHTPCQPIAIRDVLACLVACLASDEALGETFDIGGPDKLTYRQIMDIYAEEARLARRLVVPVPVLTPRLSSYWIHLVTPVHAAIARPLAEGLSSPVLCQDDRIRAIVPGPGLTCREATRIALARVEQQALETGGSNHGETSPPEWVQEGDASYAGGTVLNWEHRIRIHARPEQVWKPVAQIGGRNGWPFANAPWVLRRWLDRLAGGVGLRRGKGESREPRPGETLGFWRVLAVDRPRRLLLLAEMRTPGDATLEFRIESVTAEHTELVQTSRHFPRGLAGIACGYALYPFHVWIFRGMLRAIADHTIP